MIDVLLVVEYSLHFLIIREMFIVSLSEGWGILSDLKHCYSGWVIKTIICQVSGEWAGSDIGPYGIFLIEALVLKPTFRKRPLLKL